jgi:hypothetical protein
LPSSSNAQNVACIEGVVRAVLPVVVAVLLFAAPSRADDLPMPRLVPSLAARHDGPRDQANDAPIEPDPWASRKKTIALQGGSAGGPLGYGGIAFEYAPIPWVVGGVGGGITPDGATAAFMPRLRLPLGRWVAVGFGFPISAGPYTATAQTVDYRITRQWEVAWWGYLEPNVEFRLPRGLALRMYGGESVLLDPHDDRCTSTAMIGCPSRIGERRWYGGLSLGYAW